MVKQKKIDYQGQLRQIAASIPKNKIGLIATKIGRIAGINLPENSRNNRLRQRLLNQLFDALQIEVDSPKSAKRLEDFYPKLLTTVKKWDEKYPIDFFDFKKHPQLYRTAPLPTETKSHINVIADEAVNPLWQKARITSQNREHYRFLFQQPKEIDNETWTDYIDHAEQIKEDYRKGCAEIHQRYKTEEQIKEEYGKLYANLRAEIEEQFPEESERLLLARALGNMTTTPTNHNKIIKHCQTVAKTLQNEFKKMENYQLSCCASKFNIQHCLYF